MTKSRKFKKEYAKELLHIARGDLESAQGLIKVRMGRTENILFHIEQSIEKSLKAVLCWHEIPIPVIHELAAIVAVFPKEIPVPESDAMMDLTQFATVRRYEEGKAAFTDEEVKAAFEMAQRTLQWANKLMLAC